MSVGSVSLWSFQNLYPASLHDYHLSHVVQCLQDHVYHRHSGPWYARAEVPQCCFRGNAAWGDGNIHHVTGDITSGMYYNTKKAKRPEESRTFFGKEFLGTIKAANYPREMDEVLAALPPPPKQKKFNIKTMKTEQMKPDGTFYTPGEPRPPMIKCTEWTLNQAIPALYAAGIVQK